MSTELKSLVSKLNQLCRAAAERAASITVARGHHEVDIPHLFLALLEMPDSDVCFACRHFGVSKLDLTRDLERELQGLEIGNSRTPVFSSRVPTLLRSAWLIASLDSNDARIRSAHLLLALLTRSELAQIALRSSSLFSCVDVDRLNQDMGELTSASREAGYKSNLEPVSRTPSAAEVQAGEPSPTPELAPNADASALARFTIDLTRRAREGKIDPVVGREPEVQQVLDILLRRRQNNPILIGDAGVGKTAVVEGLALRIAIGDVPDPLKDVSLHIVDLGLLQAGASVRGEFEGRLKTLIDEVKGGPHPIVLFVDEAHVLVGAGAQAGQNDAANLLKPELARGELRTIAATTETEYKRYFEKDAALARRFQVVKVAEPPAPLAAAMLRGLTPRMEAHFKVRIRDEAVVAAVKLTARYITGRKLPDKAISVLDTACAKVALGQAVVPPPIANTRGHLSRLSAEVSALEREGSSVAMHRHRLDRLAVEKLAAESRLEELVAQHVAERALVAQVQTLREAVEVAEAARPAADLAKLEMKLGELAHVQAHQTLVPLDVNASVVAEVVAAWTGIPVGKLVADELNHLLDLQSLLEARVVGQTHALEAIAQRICTSRARLEDPDKPEGVFLFVGPSGVGKTETAIALADVLYGGDRKLLTLNMSEYQEAHSVSGLKGSPPGYVGFGEGGALTEAVRRNPYCVLLLDEADKAHPDVLDMFYQVFDKGVMDDAEGRQIDFRNCMIILTSNVGSSQILQACINKSASEYPRAGELAEMLRPVLCQSFKPALLGRMTIVPYYAIGDAELERVVRLKLDRIVKRVLENHQAEFVYDTKLVEAVLTQCTEVGSGARSVDHILNGMLLPKMAGKVLERMVQGRTISRIDVSVANDGEFECRVTA